MVAPYPRTSQAHGEESLGGVASYTKSLVDELRAHVDLQILAPSLGASGVRSDAGVGVEDVPRGDGLFLRALADLGADASIDVVHVQFEQHLFGGALANLHLLRALSRLRRTKRVVVTVHQVPDLAGIDARFLKENGFPPITVAARAWIRTQYRLLARSCDHVIVHERALANRLETQYGVAPERVGVVAHGVAPVETDFDGPSAKARLGVAGNDTLLLYFGYVTGYKGVDLLVEALETLPAGEREGLRVVIAGKSPERKLEKRSFRESIESLETRIAALSPWVERKGFLSQDDIHVHLAAADLVVFPYRQVFSASGPFALAVGQARPVIVSDAFRGMGPPEEAVFERDAGSLQAKLREFRASVQLQGTLQSSAARLREECSWARVAKQTAACYQETLRKGPS